MTSASASAVALASASGSWFTLPEERSATEPPEARGVARDEVRLLAATGGGERTGRDWAGGTEPTRLRHGRFRDLGTYLRDGDLVVVNTSATLAAAVDGVRAGGRPVLVHFSTRLDAPGQWVVELRDRERRRLGDGRPGESIALPGGAAVTLLDPYPPAGTAPTGTAPPAGTRLWRARVAVEGGAVERYLAEHGRPITYPYVPDRWPLADYQTVFAAEAGSAEMPSAGRPFTTELVTSLVTAGIAVAPITLHTGVSSLEPGETPLAERFRVPPSTARLVASTRAAGGRVVAVGTTVTRALETVARPDGTLTAGAGWTDVVLGPGRPARVVDGIVTGWHAPDASHLLLLEAVAGRDLVRVAYDEALAAGYL
ncbi:MAG: S-adenosylmethionine:tRNA ribosyltransferase-isomerase, partial [Frankia sp.]